MRWNGRSSCSCRIWRACRIRASISSAKANVDGLPPTTIVTAEDDPLRSDGERLGGKLKIATVSVEMRDYPGVTHDFFGMGMAVQKAAQAQRFVADRLKADFNPKPKDELALRDMGIAPYRLAPASP